MKVLILGGYGVFGGRLAELLAGEARLTLLIAGRSYKKAQTFCETVKAQATLTPQVFNRDVGVREQLEAINPDLVADASGPFQDYGDDPYRVVKACITLGIPYMDLADGSDFVRNIRQFDNDARAKNIFILSGVSSYPVLTAAVTRKLAQGMAQVNSITAGIAPSPYAGVGLNVIRAIASYSGKPVKLIYRKGPDIGYSMLDNMRYTVCPPGMLPLHNKRFSLVDVPDLQVLPELWPGLDSIWMGAAPVPEILQRMLNVLAWLVRLKIIPTLSPYAGLFYQAINIMRWGEHRGGMFVAIKGIRKDGREATRSWHLLAEGDDGPFIPSIAMEAIIRHMLEGKKPAPGARAAVNDLELEDYDALFKRRTIYTGFRGVTPLPPDAPLYQRVLEGAWPQLPEPIRSMHALKNSLRVKGIASVERGRHPLARFIADTMGFSHTGENIPVQVDFRVKNGKEIWKRNFAGYTFLSVQSEGKGRYQGLLAERFGPLTFGLALVLKNQKLHLTVRRWSVFGIPMPLFLAPSGDSYEHCEDGKFHFHVEITLPLIGRIVHYRGWLTPSS